VIGSRRLVPEENGGRHACTNGLRVARSAVESKLLMRSRRRHPDAVLKLRQEAHGSGRDGETAAAGRAEESALARRWRQAGIPTGRAFVERMP